MGSQAVPTAKITANTQLTEAVLDVDTVTLFTGAAAIGKRYDDGLAAARGR